MVGFLTVPVFAVESTEGKELEYEKIELPNHPLMEKATEWGIDVKGVPSSGLYYGAYEPHSNSIRLSTPAEKTFFHELAHAAHRRVKGKLKLRQDPEQEIVAELSAQVLAKLVGTEIESSLGNSYHYISGYARELNKDVAKACLSVLTEVEKVLALILS